MRKVELRIVPPLAILQEKADAAGLLRLPVATGEELLNRISPVSPDRMFVLDCEQSIFRVEWWIGNEDAFQFARQEMNLLAGQAGILLLTNCEPSATENGFAGFCFCLELRADVTSEAVH